MVLFISGISPICEKIRLENSYFFNDYKTCRYTNSRNPYAFFRRYVREIFQNKTVTGDEDENLKNIIRMQSHHVNFYRQLSKSSLANRPVLYAAIKTRHSRTYTVNVSRCKTERSTNKCNTSVLYYYISYRE